ncbi:MAG TPA: alpha-amylase [Treponema sp.]|nr:MAG: alpha-amylase [Treponema sp. GWC1_61_84]HCM26932.1 alpha-amylase [Treponema sp.]
MEFHVAREIRDEHGFDASLFSLRGNVVFADFHAVRDFARKLNEKVNPLIHPERFVKAGRLNAMGLIDEVLHYVAAVYREKVSPDAFVTALKGLDRDLGAHKVDVLLRLFVDRFPPLSVYRGELSVDQYLAGSDGGESNRALALEELMLLRLANDNPAFGPFRRLFDDSALRASTVYDEAAVELARHFEALPHFGPDDQSLWDMLRSPAVAEPFSLTGQLDYIRKRWGLVIGTYLIKLLTSLDVVKEEEKPVFFGPGPTRSYVYDELEKEYERFSPDKDWMPRTVIMAKSTLVWLSQLTKMYGRPIERLDAIPDEELDELARRGFTGLWLIGLWERSQASREIKRRCGNPEAAASAYSLHDYDIADELGGWGGLENLRSRCAWRGIKLGSDMVPNHTGIDSRWVMEHPSRFIQLDRPPYPGYSFNGGDLSNRPGIGIFIDDHYYDRSDAAVVFKRVDYASGETRYIYHGNDGTSMPWNDTAQIDFLNPEAREAVIATVVGVCKQFPIVRFDAAMTLAKKHIQRLWYPEPGRGGDIASRAERAISREEFDRQIPNEFWREVVDRCAVEAPDTLLLAEAFWMMEGFFVRTLGMHRVYNSAFMNMLKNEENGKYRATIKNTVEFDPEILKRFVNFMNNPDEETAVAQFGRGDKYFGVCTLMATMPGLPMFGHGQVEGFEEKYGMEYRRAYRDEIVDAALVERHEREVFPLLKKRRLFSGSRDFALYDLVEGDGTVNENVFAYSNREGDERGLVIYNNAFHHGSGWIRISAPSNVSDPDGKKSLVRRTLTEALGFSASSANRFGVFREQRSDLWYIRPSRELSERGLFVSLNGYQAQVFLDLHEVLDEENGRWRRLCDELGGRGVPDIRAAFQDLFLRDLYAAFAEVAKPAYFNAVRAFFEPPIPESAPAKPAAQAPQAAHAIHAAQKPPKPAPFIETLREPVLRFARLAAEYIDGASGKYESFVRDESYVGIESEAIWEGFAQSLQRLLRLPEYAAKPPAALTPPALRFVSDATGRLATEPNAAAYVAGYAVLAMLRGVVGAGASGDDAQRLVDHWCLDRKLREAYHAAGLPADEAWRIVGLLKLALVRTGAPSTLADLARLAFESDDSRSFLGVNVFGDVAWFNKERFEEALFYGTLIAAIEGDEAMEAIPADARQSAGGKAAAAAKSALSAPHPSRLDATRWHRRLDQIARVLAELQTAEAASGYSVEKLLAALGPEEPETVKAGKTAPTKTAPKKGSTKGK